MKDDFGDRMKFYEGAETKRNLLPMVPAMARLDGRSFSAFTRKMERPFDKRFTSLMVATATYLAEETNAKMTYTQSDEISLTWLAENFESEIFFGGRIQKMTSNLAALATGFFITNFQNYFEDFAMPSIPSFDCRVWNVPNTIEGANVFLWREKDASKNSISMAASAYYSHKLLMNKNSSEKQEMLWKKGINWNDYPSEFKRGTFIQKRKIKRRFTSEELANLPEKHYARKNPDLEVERSAYQRIDMPSFSKVTNRPEVIYCGEIPKS